jgi:SpoIID/LytB domain protein
VTGELGVIVGEGGLRLVNTVPLEACVPSIISAATRGVRELEELKALAVVVRSKLIHLRNAKPHADRDYDICDASHCMTIPGLQAETETSVKAAELTRNEILGKDGAPMAGDFHTACGGFTAEGVSDNGRPAARQTPFNLYNRSLKAPPDALLCLADDKTSASDVSWMLMLKPKWIENRVNLIGKVGYLKAITVLKRQTGGNALSLRLEGTAGSVILEGFDAISRALAGGALRSPLFTIRPVFKGKYPEYFLLRGIGTGEGHGYCILGAHGMAKNLGSKYTEILAHYFPNYKIKKLPRQ